VSDIKKACRTWREIVEETFSEKDPQRLQQLRIELDYALEEHAKGVDPLSLAETKKQTG